MSRTTSININVNSGKSISTIAKLKEAFEGLKVAKDSLGKEGKIQLGVELVGLDQKALASINNQIKTMAKNMDSLAVSSTNFKNSGGALNTTVNQITNNITKSSKAVDNFNTSTATTIMSIYGMQKALQIVSGSFQNYRELVDNVFGVGIASQMNISQIDGMVASFSNLSTTVPATANELSKAVDDLIRTGRTFEDSRKIIEEVAILSTASGDSLADTAGVATKVMVSLGISGDRVADTLGTMHSTAIQTASSMGYLSEAFKNVAGSASVLVSTSGLAGEELDNYKQEVLDVSMASVGALSNLGLSAS